jgi:hypothetical protein
MTNANDLVNAVVESTDGTTGRMQCTEAGLTKREYFAAMVLSAFISHPQNCNPLDVHGNAQQAVTQADALINELNKEPLKP